MSGLGVFIAHFIFLFNVLCPWVPRKAPLNNIYYYLLLLKCELAAKDEIAERVRALQREGWENEVDWRNKISRLEDQIHLLTQQYTELQKEEQKRQKKGEKALREK